MCTTAATASSIQDEADRKSSKSPWMHMLCHAVFLSFQKCVACSQGTQDVHWAKATQTSTSFTCIRGCTLRFITRSWQMKKWTETWKKLPKVTQHGKQGDFETFPKPIVFLPQNLALHLNTPRMYLNVNLKSIFIILPLDAFWIGLMIVPAKVPPWSCHSSEFWDSSSLSNRVIMSGLGNGNSVYRK